MIQFATRSNQEELMDDLSSGGQEMDQTLHELDVINKLLGGNAVTLKGIDRLIAKNPDKKFWRIIDLGCGSGVMLKKVADHLRKRSVQFELIGIDANAYIIEYAQQKTTNYPEISYRSLNIFSQDFNELKGDVFISTLFTHHFTESQLVDFFRKISNQAEVGIVINDIHRHWFAYYSIKWLTRFFSRSKMVKNDACLSVLRAFNKAELQQIATTCGFTKYSLKWKWAFRWQLIIHL